VPGTRIKKNKRVPNIKDVFYSLDPPINIGLFGLLPSSMIANKNSAKVCLTNNNMTKPNCWPYKI
jgi:hypothetical protein